MRNFVPKLLRAQVGDWRSLIGIVALVLAIGEEVTGEVILPTWALWTVVAASAYAFIFRSEWRKEQEARALPFPNMTLEDVVKRIVGRDDILATENCDNAAAALLSIREHAGLGDISVWGRRNIRTWQTENYPLSKIDQNYWYSFWINYDHFTNDLGGQSERVRGALNSEALTSAEMT